MKIVDLNNPIPKYLQISAWLRESILVGRYATGEKLPSEIELAHMCGVNRNTLRQAIGELTAQGMLKKVKGLGTFVTASEPVALKHKLNRISSFGRELHQVGIREKTRLLERGYEIPPKHVARSLALTPDSRVIAVRRLRSGDDLPLIYEETYLPVDLFNGILDMDLTGSMYEIFTRVFKAELSRCEQTIRAVNLNKKIAALLGLKANGAALYMESVTYNDCNMPVEVLCCYFRGDKYAFEVELGQYHLTQ
ncbi:MAG: GntR family transcriptional regulator [Desulfobacterales bacterium]|nr:MAG: GntR family transcriptional regulator [Desulfobacterales bacterium]